MNILIVSAHPEPASLTSALRDVAVSQMQADGHKVRVSDLYADGWKAVVDRQERVLAEGDAVGLLHRQWERARITPGGFRRAAGPGSVQEAKRSPAP